MKKQEQRTRVMNRIKKIEDCSIKKDEIIIIDTCILIFIFYTAGTYRKEKVSRCTSLFSKIINSNAKILILPELLEEFFNRFTKLEYERYLKNNNLEEKNFKYKEFRETSEFKSTLLELKEIYINQISPYAEFAVSNTHPNDICRFLNNLSEMDIKDMILCEMSKKYNAKIVTADSDYLLSDFSNETDIYFLS